MAVVPSFATSGPIRLQASTGTAVSAQDFTTFTAGSGYQTLPQWIFANISRPNAVPLVNVVATFVMVVSIPLAWLAQKLSDTALE